jgi:geranylgeranyl transferase type-1 subunit beta
MHVGGYTFCAVGALSMAGTVDTSIQDRDSLIHWLVSRQTTIMVLEEDDDEDEEEIASDTDEDNHVSAESYAGFNGRCNKPADTCYAWWIGATLKVGISRKPRPSLIVDRCWAI